MTNEKLELGMKSQDVLKLKTLLNISGNWGTADMDDVADGELMYWASRFGFEKPEGTFIKAIILAVIDYLNQSITPQAGDRDIAVAAPKPIKRSFILPNGQINPDYLVPSIVIREPFKVYGDFEDLKMGVVTLPFPLRLSWDLKSEIRRLNVNVEMADDFVNAMDEMLSVIGLTAINACGLDITGGCYNRRKIRGGTKWSSHSWGTAIDINPLANPMGKSADKTLFGTDARYLAAAEILHKHGFRTLATDNMHWQHVPNIYR